MAVRSKKQVEQVEEIVEVVEKENIFKRAITFIKKAYTKESLIELLKIFGIAYLVTFAWQQLETLIEGSIRANHVDSIIALVLVISLYGNLKVWENK